jgi:phage terminase small subunit
MKDLTDRQRTFAENLVKGMSAKQAYQLAGYKVTTDHSAEQAGSRLLRNVKVSTYLDELRAKSQDEAIWSRNRLIKYLCSVLDLDPSKLIDENTGALQSLTDMEQANLITGFKVQEKVNENGDVWGIDKDIKLYSKEKAVDQLTKLMGWNEPEKVELTGSLVERIRQRNRK